MQVRDNDTLLLYGLFQSICAWALEKGYRDISTMKNLLKLAMVDVCNQQHESKPTSAAQMAIVADLGISLRNVQYSLKSLEEFNPMATGFVKIRQIQEEMLIFLTGQPHTLDEIQGEVSYLLHAPYELQRRALRSILRDLEQKGMISSEKNQNGMEYRAVEKHVNLFDPSDISAQLSGLLTHLDAFKHTLGKPFLASYYLTAQQAEGLQIAVNEFLRGTGNSYEYTDRETAANTRPFTFYLGSAPVVLGNHPPGSVAEALLEVIQYRFKESPLPSIARTHWYHLTLTSARSVFNEIRYFLEKEAGLASKKNENKPSELYAFYYGMADRQISKNA